MNIRVQHYEVHSAEQVRAIIDQAMEIATDTTPNPEEWFAVFREACRLLGTRVSVTIQSQPKPVDLSAIGLRTK